MGTLADHKIEIPKTIKDRVLHILADPELFGHNLPNEDLDKPIGQVWAGCGLTTVGFAIELEKHFADEGLVIDHNLLCEATTTTNDIIRAVRKQLGSEMIIKSMIVRQAENPRFKVKDLTPETNILYDLGCDSLDVTCMIMIFEEEFGLETDDDFVGNTVQDFLDRAKLAD